MIGRRALLAAAVLRPGWPDLGERTLATLRARLAALPAGPALLRSYDVRHGAHATDFDRTNAVCAYVYDNALVGLALLAAGDRAGAMRIGQALAIAQRNDRFYHDGRLRNAYAAGPMTRPAKLPGWWDVQAKRWAEDPYQVGTAAGVVAWAMLLWLALDDAKLRAAAALAAGWVEANLRGPRGYRGGFIGFEPRPQPLQWVSTEHNLDLAVAFHKLGRGASAAHAAAFVKAMWDRRQGRFMAGLTPEGAMNPFSALDANVWPQLAAGMPASLRPALAGVLRHHGVPRADPRGLDFDADADGIWMEGTAFTALALRLTGRPAARFGATLAANLAPGGLIRATDVPALATGLTIGADATAPPFLYFPRPHIAPTAWAVMAARRANPLASASGLWRGFDVN